MKVKSKAAGQIHLKYLQLVRTLKDRNKLPFLDPLEESVLNALCVAWHNGESPTVLQVVLMNDIGSTPTVHRRMKSLVKKKLVQLRVNESDNRIKFVCPGELASDYFSFLDECIKIAANARVL